MALAFSNSSAPSRFHLSRQEGLGDDKPREESNDGMQAKREVEYNVRITR